MRAVVLRDFLVGTASAGTLAQEADIAIERAGDQQTHRFTDLDTPFAVGTSHLVRLCDAVIAGELPPSALEAVGFALAESRNFQWDGTTEEGARITQTVTQWAAPETSYPLTTATVAKYRQQLVTGQRAFTREDGDRTLRPRISRRSAPHRTPGRSGPEVSRVAVAGATGLVGRLTVERLAGTGSVHAVAIVRRPLPMELRRLGGSRITERVVDFDRLSTDGPAALAECEAVVCALGTTMRVAGSKEAFYRVDHDYPVALAKAAKAAGASHFILVSALGADPFSRVFYNRVKGETERDIIAVGLSAVTILRPSLLLGPRSEFRLLERVAGLVGQLVPGRYRPVKAAAAANAIVRAIESHAEGVRYLESEAIRQLSA